MATQNVVPYCYILLYSRKSYNRATECCHIGPCIDLYIYIIKINLASMLVIIEFHGGVRSDVQGITVVSPPPQVSVLAT